MKRLLLLLLFCPLVWADTPLPPDPHLRFGTLSTGVNYYIWPCDEESGCYADDRISLRLVVPIGSGVEREGEEGVAHFVEHLLFRGSEHFSESDIQRFIDAAGGGEGADANAFTSFDATVYILDLPPGDWSLVERGLAIFADFADRALIADSSVEAERGIVLEEWRLGRGATMRVMEERIRALLDESPYAMRLAIGLEETVRQAQGSTIRSFYDRWYRSVPIAIIACGPFDPDGAEKAIRASFDAPHFPVRERLRPNLTCPIPHTKHLLLTPDPELCYSTIEVSFKHPASPLQTEEDLKRELIASGYHALLQKRLFRLQEQGLLLAESIYTGKDHPLHCLETDTFQLICTPDQTTHAVGALLHEIYLASERGFTDQEWDLACIDVEAEIRSARLEGSHRSPADLANQCFSHFVLGSSLCSGAALLDAIGRIYPTITADDLHAFAKTLGHPESAFVHIAYPSSLDLAQQQIETLLEAVKWSERIPYEELVHTLPKIEPTPGPFVLEERQSHPSVLTLKGANGMQIHLMATDHERNVSFEGVALGGLADLPSEDLAAGKLASALLDESGIAGLTPTKLATALAGTDVNLSRSIQAYTRTLEGECHPADLETLLQLIHLSFTAQVNNPEIFDRIVNRMVAYDQAEKAPISALHDAAARLARSNAPYFQTPLWETAPYALSDAIGKSAFSNPADFTLSFAGSFDLDIMRALCAKYLASIPATRPAQNTFTPIDAPFPEGISCADIYKGKEAQSRVELYFPLTLPNFSPDTFTCFSAAKELIRQRLAQMLRGALSATYHVEVSSRFLYPSPQGGLLVVSFVCDPADAKLLTQVALRQMRKLKEAGPTFAEVQTHALQTERSLTEEARSNSFWSGELTNTALFGWDLESLSNVAKRPQALTKQSLHQMVDTLLPLDNYVVLTLYPEQ